MKFKLSQLYGASPVNLGIVRTDRLSNFKTMEYVCVYPELYSMIETGNELADPNSSLMKGPCIPLRESQRVSVTMIINI